MRLLRKPKGGYCSLKILPLLVLAVEEATASTHENKSFLLRRHRFQTASEIM